MNGVALFGAALLLLVAAGCAQPSGLQPSFSHQNPGNGNLDLEGGAGTWAFVAIPLGLSRASEHKSVPYSIVITANESGALLVLLPSIALVSDDKLRGTLVDVFFSDAAERSTNLSGKIEFDVPSGQSWIVFGVAGENPWSGNIQLPISTEHRPVVLQGPNAQFERGLPEEFGGGSTASITVVTARPGWSHFEVLFPQGSLPRTIGGQYEIHFPNGFGYSDVAAGAGVAFVKDVTQVGTFGDRPGQVDGKVTFADSNGGVALDFAHVPFPQTISGMELSMPNYVG